jgi:exopolyphosphatase/pppGpp-phosphohydrolase
VVSGVGGLRRWTSLPFGAVTLTERLVAADPPTAEQLTSARAW